jgi:hypothetical protein
MQQAYLPQLRLITNHAMIGCVLSGVFLSSFNLLIDANWLGVLLGASVALRCIRKEQAQQ